MKARTYQMVISDFDGTLFRSDYSIADETKKTISKFIEKGGVFAISTGRTLQSILPIARELNLKGVVSCFNGSVVADIQTGNVLFKKSLSPKETYIICEELSKIGLSPLLYSLNDYYAATRNEYLERYERIVGVKAKIMDKPILEFVKERSFSTIKALCLVHPSKRDEYMQFLQEKLGEAYYFTSGAKSLIEICPTGFSKGTAIKFLAEYYKVPIENVIAVGDSINDLPMLKTAGLGLAVKNAEMALQNSVEVYPYTNDENAVARIINQYALKEI